MSTDNVQNTHIDTQMRELHLALLEIVGAMNRPQRDEAILRAAGVSLDRALFPLLVLVERFGPIGVVDLADRVGRDYTTVSRQIAKMESLGLVDRHESATDRRIREAVVTRSGKDLTDRIDLARMEMGQAIFATWAERDIEDLVRLLRRFAESIEDLAENGPAKPR